MKPSQAEQAISRRARVRRNTQLSPIVYSCGPVSKGLGVGSLITPQTLKMLETIKTVLSGFIVVPVALVGFAGRVIAELWDRNSF